MKNPIINTPRPKYAIDLPVLNDLPAISTPNNIKKDPMDIKTRENRTSDKEFITKFHNPGIAIKRKIKVEIKIAKRKNIDIES